MNRPRGLTATIVLLLILLARWRAFDNWDCPWYLIVVCLLHVGILILCSILLQRTARQTKTGAQRKLTEAARGYDP